ATPRPAAPARPDTGAATAAVPSNPLVEALPQAWGNPTPATRPAQTPKPSAKPSTALVPLPPPQSMARMPVGRVRIGEGVVDARSAMRHSALYIVRAQTPGIVEYLYDPTGLTRMGQPLLRLYDLSILSDLRIGESVMARFATSPFVIAPRQAGLPPLPPANFPRPTVLQRLLGIRPAAQPALPAAAPATLAPAQARAQLTPETRATLAPSAGLAPAAPAAETPASRSFRSPDVSRITRTTSDITAARARVGELNDALAELEGQLARLRDDVKQAHDDAASRERLYNQGVLARNVYLAAQKKAQELEDEQHSVERRRAETTQARETALQRLAALQSQLDQEVADRRDASDNEAEDVEPQPRRASLQPSQPAAAPAPRRVVRRAAPRAARVQEAFPEPTQPRRPELRRLPRLARPIGSRLVGAPEVPSVPAEVKRLAAPRWVDQAAPSEGLVVRQLVPPGAQVQPGQPLLAIANREFARVYSDVSGKDIAKFRRGAPVTIGFDSYPGVTLEGWVNDIQPEAKSGLARVEMVVTAREGYCPDDTYASLQWLALAAPLVDDDSAEAMAPATEEAPVGPVGPRGVYDLLPLVPPEVGPARDRAQDIKDNEYVGVVRMGEMSGETATAHSSPENAARLARLREWRNSFTAGMQTGIFGNLVLTYPRDQEVSRAVERMATASVDHIPNMCAGTMREALGWGLGDAAQWLKRLPERGYLPRKDGLARPGDILVWPFTYGSRHSQHIGVAVNQGGKLMLLSNLSGTLGTTELTGGYVAFYRPTPKDVKPQGAKSVAINTRKPSAAR
ncbi:efflux RND transporter periplasmic adaptor subunit, partial [bacterium]|nr:efflux RND transporter periplasmic adaptor subunit [bacterium]